MTVSSFRERACVALFAGLVAATPSLSSEEAYPAFSPDGKWLVFSSDAGGSHDLYLVDASGRSQVRLTEASAAETQPTWSPDGKSIAYIRQPWNPSSPSTLAIIDRDGKNPRRVGSLKDVQLPHWAGDGRLYFSMRVGRQLDIFSLRPDGQDLVNHTQTPEIDEANVDVRQQLLVYDQPDGEDYAIGMLDLKTGTKKLWKSGGTYWDPVWTADGQGLLVGVYAQRDATLSRLTELDLSGTMRRQWTPDDRNVFWPTVSPDGKSVVFSYSEKDFGVGELYRLDLKDGSIRRFLAPE